MPEAGASPATDFSVALLQEFARLGIRHVVLAPGSRSQALALACAELERIGAITLHVRLDERGAAFLAIGIAVETGVPALVVTTSGTAVANLHPAVLEAHHSGVPLILLTADRPDELRGIRSNQTTHQPGIFGTAVRLSEDVPAPDGDVGEAVQARALAKQATDAAAGTLTHDPGPAQLNLAFREPLSAATSLAWDRVEASAAGANAVGATTDETDAAVGTRLNSTSTNDRGHAEPGDLYLVPPGPRTIVVAGHGAGPAAEEFARAGGWPLLAEVSSGSHFGPNLVVAYRALLREDDWGGQVERVIVFGHPTLSREVPALIQRDGPGGIRVETIVVAPTGIERYNPGHRVQTFVRQAAPDAASVALAGDRETRAWTGRWVMASRQLRDALDAEETGPDVAASVSADYRVRGGFAKAELAALRAPVTRELLVDAVWRASWPHDRLVFGASRLIREADRRVPGKKISVHSNRGLAGIDGTIATATGIALASQSGAEPRSTGVTRVLLGDLTLLHDVGSLLLTPAEILPRLQIIVGNDGGGTIFDGLEVAASAPAAAMDRVLYTPQQVDLAALAAAYGWGHTLVTTRSELEKALTAPVQGPAIVEVPLPR